MDDFKVNIPKFEKGKLKKPSLMLRLISSLLDGFIIIFISFILLLAIRSGLSKDSFIYSLPVIAGQIVGAFSLDKSYMYYSENLTEALTSLNIYVVLISLVSVVYKLIFFGTSIGMLLFKIKAKTVDELKLLNSKYFAALILDSFIFVSLYFLIYNLIEVSTIFALIVSLSINKVTIVFTKKNEKISFILLNLEYVRKST